MGLRTSDGRQVGHQRLVVRTSLLSTAGVILGVFALAWSAAPASAAAPEAPVTEPATGVTATTATLNGELNPSASATVGYLFDYNTNGICTEGPTTQQEPEATGEAISVSTPLTGLEPSREYTFCVVATHLEGETTEATSGEPVSFTTLAAPPAVDGESSSVLAPLAARLEAQVNPNNQATSCEIQYGSTVSYGSRVPCEPSHLEGFGEQPVAAAVSNLEPGTEYHFRVLLVNASHEATAGSDSTFTTPAFRSPVIDEQSVGSLTPFEVTLQAQVNPFDEETTYSSEYATEEAQLGTPSATTLAGASPLLGFGDQPASAPTGAVLQPATTYFYRVLATNATGTSTGASEHFTTPATQPPVVEGESVFAVLALSATVQGQVNPEFQETTCQFLYGTDPTLAGATSVPCSPEALGAAGSPVEATAALTGLQPGTTYYYRVLATNATGPTEGPIEQFATHVAPAIAASEVGSITRTTAVITGEVDPHELPTEYFIEYGPHEPHGAVGSPTRVVKLPAEPSGPQPIAAQTLEELTAATTYHYRLTAVNEAGTTRSPEGTFTTASAQPPSATTGEANEVTQTSATITGTVSPNGLPTDYAFEIGTDGTDNTYDTRIFGETAPGVTGQPVRQALTSLLPGTTYHYRLVATNPDAASSGADHTFTTPGFSTQIASAAPAFALLSFILPQETKEPPAVNRPLTRAQQLAKALRACRRLHGRRRAACVKRAYHLHGPVKTAKARGAH